MSEQVKKELTPAERALQRTGPCIATVCSERCEGFVFTQKQDGFRLCACSHTQYAHAYGEGTVPS